MRYNLIVMLVVGGWALGCSSSNGFSGGPSPQSAVTVTVADRIFFGGHILTVKPAGEVEALAVRGDRILAVGDRASILAMQGPQTRLVDLQGKTLMPGFVEPHVHIDTTALDSLAVPLYSEAPNVPIAQVLATLQAEVGKVPAGGWLIATGFDPARTSPLFTSLNVTLLDQVSTTVPIFVLNASEHIAYVNSKAFQVAGVTNATPDPLGGTYVKDANGNLTGQLNEAPSYRAFAATFPTAPDSVILAAFRNAMQTFAQAGVTAVGDLNTGIAYGVPQEVGILQTVCSEPATPIRVFCYLAYLALDPTKPLPVQPNQGNDMLRFIGIKFTLDGSTQGFTAALKKPYLNSTSAGSLIYADTKTLVNLARPFVDAGWQLSMHANGDLATDQVLDAYEQLLGKDGNGAARRFRLEHFTVTEEAQVDRLKALGITPSLTIGHTFYWGQVFFQAILGPERASRLDPLMSLKSRGIPFSLNSDCPTTTVAPLRYIQNAVTRIPQLTPPAVLGPEQRITIDDALRAVTLDAAFQMFMDEKIGSLEPGKLADLVILDGNPRTVDPTTISTIQVLETYLGGQKKI